MNIMLLTNMNEPTKHKFNIYIYEYFGFEHIRICPQFITKFVTIKIKNKNINSTKIITIFMQALG